MDAESKQQAALDVLTAAKTTVDAYREQRRSLYRTFGLDKLVKALDALDDAVMLHEATIPMAAPPEQTKLGLRDDGVVSGGRTSDLAREP
jgi:hypothetical protein